MSKHDPGLAMQQVLAYAREAVDISRGKTEKTWMRTAFTIWH